jgi:multidrug efflux pump subunit AcrB/outer membrane protein TolC
MKTPGGFIERAMDEWRIVVTVIAGLVAIGVQALLTMPRQEFPEFTIRQGLVLGVMPGASSSEVEEQLAKPVEEYLFTYGEVNKAKTYSESANGMLVVHVELREEIKGVDSPAFWVKLRHGLNELRAQKLPPNVVALVGMNDFADTSAVLLALTADGRSPRDLEQYVEVLEKHLRRLEATSKLKRVGLQEEVIRVTVSHERLARYGIRAQTLWATLQGLGHVPAAARLDTETLELPVHVGDIPRSEQEVGDTIVLAQAGGGNVRLKDVATITREYGHDDSLVLHDDQTAVVLSVEMRKLDDIVAYGKKVEAAVAGARRELPPDVKIWRVADQPEVVKHSVGHFMRDFGIAIVSVVLVTMLLLPLRVAAVAAVTIPVCIFITLGILAKLGVELQTVSLAGLIIVLGMVVDNAIVIIDDHVEKLDHGMEVRTAAWKSAREMFIPVFTATIAIIMSYLPFTWFMTGMGGDFLASLPVTIGVALATSMVVATLLVPILTSRFIRQGLHRARAEGDKPARPSMLDRLQRVYDVTIEGAFRWPILTVGIGVASVAIAILLARSTPQQLFPKLDRAQFAVEISLPPGRPLHETEDVARRVSQALRKDKRVVDVTSFIGTSSPRFHTLYEPRSPARNRAQLVINTIGNEATVDVIRAYEPKLASSYAEGWVRFKRLDLQNSPAPVEARFSGDDLGSLRDLAARVQAYARTIPGVTWVRLDTEEPIQIVEVTPDQDSLARLGLSRTQLALTLASTSRKGFEIGSIWEGDYRVPVLLADDPRAPMGMEQFRSQYVSSPILTAPVPLEEVAKVQPGWNDGTRIRRNGTPTITVRVDVGNGVLASPVQQKIERFVAGLGPLRDVTVSWGGEAQSMVEQYTPLTMSLLTSIGFINLILLFQFRRHKKALVVMLTMPLSLFGSFLGLKLTGYPFSFTAFLGVISLMGIVVRNGIILVGYAEELHHGGLGLREAAIAAGKRRMRPIFLTSAAAAVGVVPLITSGSMLWGPLGAVTCFGLLLSMILTLFVLPVAYWLMLKSSNGSSGPAARVVGVAAVILACLAGAPALAQAGPLTLDQVRARAAEQNASVREAKHEIASAQETKKAAYTKYFPQASVTGSAVRSRSPLTKFDLPGASLPVLDASGAPTGESISVPAMEIEAGKRVTTLSFTAVQPIYMGGRIRNSNRLAELGIDVAREEAAIARRDAVAVAEEMYWRVLQLRERERTLTAYQAMLEQMQKQVDDAVKSGLATRSDALEVAVKRKDAEVDRLKLDSAIRVTARDLRRHIGLPEGDTLELADDLAEPVEPAAAPEERSGGTDRRPEVRQLRRAVRAAELETAIKRADMLPTVSIGATALYNSMSGASTYHDVLAFASVTIPLTGIWEGAHTTRAQEEKRKEAEIRLADGRDQIRIEIEKRWDDLTASWRAVAASQLAVEQAEVDLREESDKWQNGLTEFSDLLEAQVYLHRAQDHLTDARTQYWLDSTAYARAVGGG